MQTETARSAAVEMMIVRQREVSIGIGVRPRRGDVRRIENVLVDKFELSRSVEINLEGEQTYIFLKGQIPVFVSLLHVFLPEVFGFE